MKYRYNFMKLQSKPGRSCGFEATGCYVRVVASNATGVMHNSWTRGCCFDFGEIGHCTEVHEDVDNMGGIGRTDQSW